MSRIVLTVGTRLGYSIQIESEQGVVMHNMLLNFEYKGGGHAS